jgi:hypothetical protein
MTGSDHASHWLEMLKDEIVRRRAAKLEAAGGDARERLYRELDEMAARVQAAPNYVEPTAEEKGEMMHELDRWLTEHYGAS